MDFFLVLLVVAWYNHNNAHLHKKVAITCNSGI